MARSNSMHLFSMLYWGAWYALRLWEGIDGATNPPRDPGIRQLVSVVQRACAADNSKPIIGEAAASFESQRPVPGKDYTESMIWYSPPGPENR